MTAPPSACSGVITSPRKIAEPMVASSGSRFMNSAVRNGPTRAVEMNTISTAIAIATLEPISANQPSAVTGGCQFAVASAAATNTAVAAISDHRVISRAVGALQLGAREQQDHHPAAAAISAQAMPISATPPGCAPIISARPANAASAASRPASPSRSTPNAAAASPVSSG